MKAGLPISISRGVILVALAVLWSAMLAIGSDQGGNDALVRGDSRDTPAAAQTCSGALPQGSMSNPQDLIVNGPCTVAGAAASPGATPITYYYGNINIVNGGSLTFDDAQIDFWASSIIVENQGSLIAGSSATPIGTNGRGPTNTTDAVVTINLWGAQQTPSPGATPMALGVACVQKHCGVPDAIWDTDGNKSVMLANGVKDRFYKYEGLMFDDGPDMAHPQGYFGYKTIGLAYGGTLQLFGKKGATIDPQAVPSNPLLTGTSWVRLDQSLQAGATTLVVEGDVTGSTEGAGGAWEQGDNIVVTSTDYVPGHAEEVTITSAPTYDAGTNQSTMGITAVQWAHNGTQYDLTSVSSPSGPINVETKLGLDHANVDTRAAAGLLSRSIVIQSGGDTIGSSFPPAPAWSTPAPSPGYYFGGHMVIRQGFETAEIQGVEFSQMGQGGEMGHYPVHFHMARTVPAARTFVKDSSINESMTRWIVLHGTQDVTLARNVGYLSIGHGFMLEDATETDNNIFANLGVFARGALINSQNPRQVPGILAEGTSDTSSTTPYFDDWEHPTVFWISNGWNDIEGNMAAGAGSCGMCYWDVPQYVGGDSANEHWKGYASLQEGGPPGGGLSPLKVFDHNSCSSAQYAFMSVASTSYCEGIGDGTASAIQPVSNDLAPSCSSGTCNGYYPGINPGGQRIPTRCSSESKDCNTKSTEPNPVQPCGYGSSEKNCMVNVLDHFTTSFNWAQTNFAAVWLRANWFLFTNGSITDQQHAGMTMIPGAGGYEQSLSGVWVLADKSVFLGHTQPQAGQTGFNPYASDAGPFVTDTDGSGDISGLTCDSSGTTAAYCNSIDQGISVPFDGFATFQRMFSIYDGPAYQDANAYLDINVANLNGCTPGAACTNYPMALATGVLKNQTNNLCYLQNAAIAWKQPNGFYYPPAFHSSNLLFSNVDIRHFVFQPDYSPKTYTDNVPAEDNTYCFVPGNNMFNGSGFTDIDRQTELSDDDGSLTGFINSISVNEDPFFGAPYQTPECASNLGIVAQATPTPTPSPVPPAPTVDTSPYEYVTTAIYPKAGPAPAATCAGGPTGTDWCNTCTGPTCTGVPLYREDQTGTEQGLPPHFIRMAGEAVGQRSSLTVNNGFYYIDTTTTGTPGENPSSNPFEPGHTYDVFFLFAKQETSQTFQMYVGTNLSSEYPTKNVHAMRVKINTGAKAGSINPRPHTTWPSQWTRTYDPTTGLLTVTTNMSSFTDLIGFDPPMPATQSTGLCEPSSFCSWNGKSCGCNASSSDYPLLNVDSNFQAECTNVCQNWAVRDLDCPTDGCYGFEVTLPSTFNSSPATNPLPTPLCYAQTADWTMPFGNANGFDAAATPVAGACAYSGSFSGNFCAAPTPTPTPTP